MTVWCVSIDRREEHEGNGSLGPFASRAGAVQAVRDYVTQHYRAASIDSLLKTYGGDLTEGTFYSEEEIIGVYERELLP